jgi:predicted O-linked N-acetylglucosamine transferase (SPINDLY family)
LFLSKQRRFEDAINKFNIAIRLAPNFPPIYSDRGNALNDLRRYREAITDHNRAISLAPQFCGFYSNRGNTLRQQNEYTAALSDYDRAIQLNPNYADAFNGRGNVLYDLKRYDEAFAAYDKALSIKPDLAEAWLGRGNALHDLKHYDDAFAAYDKALSIKPDLAEAWLCRGRLLYDLKRHDEAFAAYDKALSGKPDLADAWVGRGHILCGFKRHEEAFAAYDKALSIKPDLAEAWLGRGNALYDLRSYDEAFAAYDKALSVKPDLAEAWLGRGHLLYDLKRYDEAFAAYDKARSIKPDLEGVEGSRLNVKMRLCNWERLDKEISDVTSSIRAGKANSPPFPLLALTDYSDDHRRCAEAWVAAKHPTIAKSVWQHKVYKHDKIRLGYVSADLRKHVMGFILAELFEVHDKTRFSITAFSLGGDDNSDVRRRLVSSFDRFVDCHELSDFAVAQTIADSEIDILVDLNGFTQGARTNIFAHRAAPIQVNYLGYPGTMGAPYIDYIIGDKTLFTPADVAFYSEKRVQLPHSYKPNDSKQQISARTFTRQEAGLPESGFVFCSFNNNYKILPQTFDCWMRILKRVEGSVLWLLAENQTAKENLKREAGIRGIDPARLVFADRMDLPDHLARHRIADLFLDTLPYNAHTTASDALWAGLPALTQVGETFAARVAASLLKAIGLPELITHSPEEYEALAIELALNNEKLQSIREKLDKNRHSTPLFDTPLYVRHLEAAYEAMYRRYQAGLPPDYMEIRPLSH